MNGFPLWLWHPICVHFTVALLPAGAMGDRASLSFSDPGEISGIIATKCG